jgi:hypothetical protein
VWQTRLKNTSQPLTAPKDDFPAIAGRYWSYEENPAFAELFGFDFESIGGKRVGQALEKTVEVESDSE